MERRVSLLTDQFKGIKVKLESNDEEKERKCLDDFGDKLIETDLEIQTAKRQMQNVKNLKHLQAVSENIQVILFNYITHRSSPDLVTRSLALPCVA